MIPKRSTVSEDALSSWHEDQALADRSAGLLAQASADEAALRTAQAALAPLPELRELGKKLDASLTDAMRAAYAAQRAAIGPRGYDDWIYRRKAMATPGVRSWTMEAERLLTLREIHRLTGIPKLPRTRVPVPPEAAASRLH